MPRHVSDDEEPLEDKTAALTLHNKRTERLQKKEARRASKRDAIPTLSKLPTELILEILYWSEPLEVFRLKAVNRRLFSLVNANEAVIAETITSTRYSILAQCFPTPKLLSGVDSGIQELLVDPKRQTQLGIHKRPYQHIQSPDPRRFCTCLTCILTWNNLGLVLDFAHWQNNLDSGQPIPLIPRDKTEDWNVELISRNATIVQKATENQLWHALILQKHLDSTVRSIKRHSKNKGNRKTHVAMTEEDSKTGTDQFLTKYGPPSLEFPYQRDEYYMLEAYLPNRWWRKNEGRWVYTIGGQHERDLELVQRFAQREQLALLSHIMSCIDEDTWMTDVLHFKNSMFLSQAERASSSSQPLRHYAVIV